MITISDLNQADLNRPAQPAPSVNSGAGSPAKATYSIKFQIKKISYKRAPPSIATNNNTIF